VVPALGEMPTVTPHTFRGFVTQSPLWLRVSLLVFTGFILGGLSRFTSTAAAIALLLLLLVAAGLIVWVIHGAFARSTGSLTGRKTSPRGLRIPSGILSIVLLLPLIFGLGFGSALGAVPYSEAELAAFAAQEAAEAEALRLAQEEAEAQLAAERAAQEAQERAEREALEKLEKLAADVEGGSLEDAAGMLSAAGVAFDIKKECVDSPADIVLSSSVTRNGLALMVSANATTVPDVIGDREASARLSLTDSCYTTTTKTYYAAAPEGTVMQTDPPLDTPLDAGQSVTLFIAQQKLGTRDVADSVGRWSYLGPRDEEWGFWSPFEKEGKLYIPIYATFSTDMEWRDPYETGSGFGTAVIIDEFNKEVPISVLYGKKTVASDETQYFTAVVPLTDLNNRTPTKVYLYLAVEVNGKPEQVKAEFTMSW
jgi:hypothetical protein